HPYTKGFLKVAWGFGSEDGLIQHTRTARGVEDIDFFSGKRKIALELVCLLKFPFLKKPHSLKTHGIFMFVAWFLIIPATGLLVMIAHYFEKYPWWFNVHRIFNTIAMLLVLVGFFIAVSVTESHFDSLHKILGWNNLFP